MNILFLTKRYYTGRDLIADRYGRLYEIPSFLSKLGHTLELVCHSYRNSDEIIVGNNPNLTMRTHNLGANPVTGFWKHYQRLDGMIQKSRPDIIIAASDCYQIIIGSSLARKYSIPFIADLYDNFVSFKASRIPGVVPLFIRALKHADAVTVVSSTLLERVKQRYMPAGSSYLIENAVSQSFVTKHDRQISRQHFHFEPDRTYIGMAGDLSREKDVDLLIKTFTEIVEDYDNLSLVLAGRKEKKLNIPDREDVIYLGMLPHNEVPVLFSGLDIGVVCIRDDEFGRYCFPQKFYEMVACGLPVIAAGVDEMHRLLKGYPGLLYRPGDRDSLKQALLRQLEQRRSVSMDVPTWKTQTEKFDDIIRGIASMRTPEFSGRQN